VVFESRKVIPPKLTPGEMTVAILEGEVEVNFLYGRREYGGAGTKSYIEEL